MAHARPLSDLDLELLSGYLDGELTESERQALETRLQTDAVLRAELDSLRQTVALIRTLEPARAPRSYALTPDMIAVEPTPAARRVIAFPSAAVFSVLSAAAAIVLLAFGVSFLSVSQAPVPAPADIVMLAPTDTAVIAQPFDAGETMTQRQIVTAQMMPTQTMMLRASEIAEAQRAAPFAADSALVTPEITSDAMLFSVPAEPPPTLPPEMLATSSTGVIDSTNQAMAHDQAQGSGGAGGAAFESASEAPAVVEAEAPTQTLSSPDTATATSTEMLTPTDPATFNPVPTGTVAPAQPAAFDDRERESDQSPRATGWVLIGAAVMLFIIAGAAWMRRSTRAR